MGITTVLPTEMRYLPCQACNGTGHHETQVSVFDAQEEQWYPHHYEIECDTCHGSRDVPTLVCAKCQEPVRDCACDEIPTSQHRPNPGAC